MALLTCLTLSATGCTGAKSAGPHSPPGTSVINATPLRSRTQITATPIPDHDSRCSPAAGAATHRVTLSFYSPTPRVRAAVGDVVLARVPRYAAKLKVPSAYPRRAVCISSVHYGRDGSITAELLITRPGMLVISSSELHPNATMDPAYMARILTQPH